VGESQENEVELAFSKNVASEIEDSACSRVPKRNGG
jgi:hypothetical protein